MPPIVGIPACARLEKGQLRHDTPARYAAAVLGGAGAVPIMIPPMGEASLAVLDRLDGLLLSGSPSNVHPSHYDGGDSLTPDHHDLERDATTLRLIPEALARGMPLLAICRGIQELNVALGGTLHQKVHEVPDRMDHRPGPGTIDDKYAPRHLVFLSGQLARIVGSTKILVNSVHGQAIDTPGAGTCGGGAGAGQHDRGGAGRTRPRVRAGCAVASGMGLRRRQRQPRAVPRVRRGVRGVSSGAKGGMPRALREASGSVGVGLERRLRWTCNWPARRP